MRIAGKRFSAVAVRRFSRLLVMFFLSSPALFAQIYLPANHAELDWFSFETEHFVIHYHEGAVRTARVVARVAEDVFTPITTLYGFTPDEKINFIIRDHDDYSNGAAYYYDNKIEIWASSMDFELRGSHNWLRNVVAHEFTHMIQLQSARKFSKNVPAMYLQWIGYEKEARPDVLYGYPNTIVSYPIAFTVIPSWFAEGVSQYQIPGLNYDNWDAHRDMMLRTAVLEDKMLTFDQMGSFGKNSVGNERAYNQGYAFVAFLAQRYGLDVLRRISVAMKAPLRFSFSRAMQKATGKSGYALYAEWKTWLEKDYAWRTRDIEAHLRAGKLVEKQGIGNFYPRWSADGSKLAYLTSGGQDYLSFTSLVVRDMASGKNELIRGGVRTAFDWSADGRYFIYAKKTDANKYGSRFFDLYLYDTETKKEKRLTRDARAHSPSFSPDMKWAACVINADGTQNLARIDLETLEIEPLTAFVHGEQVFTPRWSPDGGKILYSVTKGEGRKLAVMNLADKTSEQFDLAGPDVRDAAWAEGGNSIIFSSSKTGIFNIYSLDVRTGRQQALTNVLGGAFMPSVSPDSGLVFASFYAEGYKIARIPKPQPVAEQKLTYYDHQQQVQVVSMENTLDGLDVENIKAPNYDDTRLPDIDPKPYKNTYSPMAMIPRIMSDYGTVKAGAYFFSSDVLENYSIISGFAVNRAFEYDLFGIATFNKFGPQLFVEAFNQVRKSSAGTDRYRYNLGEVNVGVQTTPPYRKNHLLRLAFTLSNYNTKLTLETRQGPFSISFAYFKGKAAHLRYYYYNIAPAIDAVANPRHGRVVSLDYKRHWNRFINGFAVNSDYGTLQEVYTAYNYNELSLDWREYFGLPKKNSLMLRFKGGYIDEQNIDSFFYFFGGGLDGNRGYPFYSMEGRKLLHGTVAWRFPVLWNIDKTLLHLYFDKLYFGLFADYTAVYNQSKIDFGDFRKAAGSQLRLEMFSFYGYPTRLFFDAAYGFDSFLNRGISYGNEWRYYFGITFGFFD